MSLFANHRFHGQVPQWKLNNITDRDLARFCVEVRQKKDWKTQILDEKIALEWAIEEELAATGTQILAGRIREAVSDLRRSALALEMLESNISLNALDSSLEPFDMNMIEAELKNTLKYARGSKYALREPELKETGLGVFVSDDLVPQALHKELIRQLDALAEKEPRDFYPVSLGKVQNLIHPSLYPYIAGTTPVSSLNVKLPPTREDNKFHTKLFTQYPQDMISSYAWIPSVFQISSDGTDVHIDSYIAGLGTREQYPSLFRVIEKMFLLALPHFEKTLKTSAEYATEYSPSVKRWTDRRDFAVAHEAELTRQMWAQFLSAQSSTWDAQQRDEKQVTEVLQQDIKQEDSNKTSFYDIGDEFFASKQYKGRGMKVIVKAANYILTPGQEHKGSWHMEGMPHEQIVASVIYYYDSDGPIQDEGLSFRKFRDTNEDFPPFESVDYTYKDFSLTFTADNGDDDGGEDHYPSDWELDSGDEDEELAPFPTTSVAAFIELGTVPTTNIRPGSNGTGRILSFPNWLQHKVARVKNTCTSGDCVASRKIFCFFLVDDTSQEDQIYHHGFALRGLATMNVLTTSEVPMQMRRCNKPTMFALISAISARLAGGTALPSELLDIIWRYASEGTMTREEAEMHRLRLMNDRKVANQVTDRLNNYSLRAAEDL
ncbi:hypothetical protein BDP27DRAFT_1330170 [Rhodocollybia butyracea]|uniref:DUF4246 domain-containing protein n=1 Tax=Rhodocollybia butyracea TaxID=206335 RepID=A0A9P5PNX1_9AGAR|nr:hypothetical protein BDP27DRAFT_1330170 [Rhodocollybia butyracea]